MNSPLYIPEPCHENWEKMTPTEKGKFCKVCTKEVVDFSEKKLPDILTYLETANGTTCGKFSFSQLNQNAQEELTKSKKSPVRKWVLSTLAMMGMLGWFKESKAQLKGKVAIRGEVAYVETHDVLKDSTVIVGKVTEQYNNRPVGGAEVLIYTGENLIGRTKTIANGSYRIALKPGTVINKKISIHVSDDNFLKKEINDFTITKAQHRINIAMEEELMVLGQVMYTPDDTIANPEDTIDFDRICFIGVDTSVASENLHNTDSIVNIQSDSTTTNRIEKDSENDRREQKQQLPIEIFVVTEKDLQARIYPNPAKDYATIETGMVSKFSVRVMDLEGKLIGQTIFTGQKSVLDLYEFAPGIYMVEITDIVNGNKTVIRVVKP